MAGLSPLTGDPFSDLGTAWLATQWNTNLSPRNFPANREFYRENHDFSPQGGNSKASNRCAAETFQQIP
jgi:hypothetical protein